MNGNFKKITVMRTIVLVNTLARLHNFCLGEVMPIQLETNTENIINWEEGYVVLENSNKHRIAMPTTLMDVGHRFDDMPRIAGCNIGEDETPRKILEDIFNDLSFAAT